VDAPRLSVVIPTFDRRAAVVRAVESVLAQEGPSLEVVVVDDGSTDGTAAALAERFPAEPRLVVLAQANGGTARARNAGIAAARGELVALLDSDDRWLPGCARAQVAALDAHPDAALAVCDARYVTPSGASRGTYRERVKRPPLSMDDLLEGRWPQPSCMAFRAVVLRALPFDPAWHGEDTEQLFRFFAAGHRAVAVAEVLAEVADGDAAEGAPRKMSSHETAKREHTELLAAYAAHAKDPRALARDLARRRALLHARAGRFRAARADAWRWWRLAPLQLRAPWILVRGLFGEA
jgi:glycosyltransferase involved in cell wall biosynthesis